MAERVWSGLIVFIGLSPSDDVIKGDVIWVCSALRAFYRGSGLSAYIVDPWLAATARIGQPTAIIKGDGVLVFADISGLIAQDLPPWTYTPRRSGSVAP
jgi:hypothetical protein